MEGEMGRIAGDLGALEEGKLESEYMKQISFQLKKNKGKETKNGVSPAATKV